MTDSDHVPVFLNLRNLRNLRSLLASGVEELFGDGHGHGDHHRKRVPCVALVALLLAAVTPEAGADVTLPAVVGDHMVLQRGQPLPIWGWAEPGEAVTVRLRGKKASTEADAEGNWKVVLPAMKARGKPLRLTIEGNNKIVLENVLIGDVWIGSGQSNMEWHLRSSHAPQRTIASAKDPWIRLFHVPKVKSGGPAKDVKATWQVCSPEAAATFSAVLYYFGLRVRAEVGVPIGLINSSWGGSPIEPWTTSGGHSGDMYNGMIAPLQPFAIRGVTWYQGETNVLNRDGLSYYDKMKALIEGWREAWGSELPFYFVQIAPWAGRYGPGELPALWEAQVKSLTIPGTGMVVTTDLVDNIRDIHPRNKRDVGDRLARWALAKTYGKKVVYSGPLYTSMEIEGNTIRLHFAHTAGGLGSSDGKPLREFQIAGEDGEFVEATAVVDGHTVLVRADGLDAPKHVRFGWHKVANPNLVNKAGLPASPFQTDGWQGGTGE